MEQKIMGNRIEKVRAYVDDVLLHMTDTVERRCAYVHLYGVAQACAMIALKRKENVELAIVAGMLHDIFSYKTMNHQDHAHFTEILIDADVLQHYLYNPFFTVTEVDKKRLENLKREFGLS